MGSLHDQKRAKPRMATLLDIFTNGHTEMRAGHTFTMNRSDGAVHPTFEIRCNCHYSTETNTRFASYYIPETDEWSAVLEYLLNNPSFAIDKADETVEIEMSNPSLRVMPVSGKALKFSGRMYIYVDVSVPDEEHDRLQGRGMLRGLSIELRDRNWLEAYTRAEKPAGFISHDSRDKDEVVRPLVYELGRRLCSVWYDEYSLKIGDSLSDSIGRGIEECKKCILILSPAFLSNTGWSKTEFRAIITRHIDEGNIVLPVWHNVDKKEIRHSVRF